MRRSEPSLGNADLADLDTGARHASFHKGTPEVGLRGGIASWLATGTVLAAVFVGLPLLGFHLGLIGQLKGSSPLLGLPSSLILGGLALVWFIQLAGTVFLFSRSMLKGVLSFFVPGYWFFALGREPAKWPFVGFTIMGFVLYALGAYLASRNAI